MNTKELFKAEFRADAPMQVDRLAIKWVEDESPDISYLGEYSNTPEEHHIDRKERGDQGRNEYRYFNLGAGDPEYLEQDYKRAEALNRGEWCSMGCMAEAEVSYPCGQGNRRIQRFTSSGLWGIESDSDDKYKAEVEADELENLRKHLAQFNIPWPLVEAQTIAANI